MFPVSGMAWHGMTMNIAIKIAMPCGCNVQLAGRVFIFIALTAGNFYFIQEIGDYVALSAPS